MSNAKELLLKLARHLRNTDGLLLPAWGAKTMDLLSEVQARFPKEYDEHVKGKDEVNNLRPLPKDLVGGKPAKKSTYIVQKERQEAEYVDGGQYTNNTAAWTNHELDNLLALYLEGIPFLAKRGVGSLVDHFKRPLKALEKALWRLAVRDPERQTFWRYTPGDRRGMRDGQEFTDRDDYLICLATSPKGIEYGGYTYERISAILNRSITEVREHLSDLWVQMHSTKATLRKGPAFNYSKVDQIDKLHKFLKERAKRSRVVFTDE